MVELADIHETMREFAVDLTTHPDLATTIEAIGAVAVIGITEAETRKFVEGMKKDPLPGPELAELEAMLDQIDTEQRITQYAARIRATLESEALLGIVAADRTDFDRDRRIAALRAATDEVRQTDIKDVLTRMLSGI